VKDLEKPISLIQQVLGDKQFRSWFFAGMVFSGVLFAFIRGWSMAFPHLLIIYVVAGWAIIAY